jgi:hypothetical protein
LECGGSDAAFALRAAFWLSVDKATTTAVSFTNQGGSAASQSGVVAAALHTDLAAWQECG